MQGAGNDFIVLDGINQTILLDAERCRRLADRRFGVGADQILLVEKSSTKGIDFMYRIFNADGGEVEQCGNGARAFVRFVVDKQLTTLRTIRVATLAGVIAPTLHDDGTISVDMGVPIFDSALIPFVTGQLCAEPQGNETLWTLIVKDRSVQVGLVSMGNPHAVQIVDSIDTANVSGEGPVLENHPNFPRRVNVGFLEVVDRHHVRLRVFERGVGETLACGTGACAAAVSGIRRGVLDSPVQVTMQGGVLSVEWQGDARPVTLSGPAETVFEGEITL